MSELLTAILTLVATICIYKGFFQDRFNANLLDKIDYLKKQLVKRGADPSNTQWCALSHVRSVTLKKSGKLGLHDCLQTKPGALTTIKLWHKLLTIHHLQIEDVDIYDDQTISTVRIMDGERNIIAVARVKNGLSLEKVLEALAETCPANKDVAGRIGARDTA